MSFFLVRFRKGAPLQGPAFLPFTKIARKLRDVAHNRAHQGQRCIRFCWAEVLFLHERFLSGHFSTSLQEPNAANAVSLHFAAQVKTLGARLGSDRQFHGTAYRSHRRVASESVAVTGLPVLRSAAKEDAKQHFLFDKSPVRFNSFVGLLYTGELFHGSISSRPLFRRPGQGPLSTRARLPIWKPPRRSG